MYVLKDVSVKGFVNIVSSSLVMARKYPLTVEAARLRLLRPIASLTQSLVLHSSLLMIADTSVVDDREPGLRNCLSRSGGCHLRP